MHGDNHPRPGTYDRPSDVVVDEGRVLVDGPGEVYFALTPPAAHETGRRLKEAADKAEQASPPDEADRAG